ncbi:MAG: Hippurate hydrolase [Burkholderia plantarii]|nr:MAG: Hippurate hydrolase [Burkholderia plantarii]
MSRLLTATAAAIDTLLPELDAIYRDLHQHPELSMQETRTARVAGVLRNGEGPVVMLRADMDALPVTEATGLPYASTVTARDEEGIEVGVAHACGHDLHVTWLMGAARLLSEHRDAWRGTVLAVFQPGEEVGTGAQSMIDAGFVERFPKPDVILGQHVMVGPAGTVGHRAGTILSAGDSLKIRLFGRGSHGSQPQTSVDPVILAALTTLRLQTIVSREIAPQDSAVLTIGALQAGTKENIIPEEATLKLNMRTYDEDVRDTMLGAIRRICCAESVASNSPREPEFTTLSRYPMTINDAAATGRVSTAFDAWFGERAYETPPAAASEDFSVFGRTWGVPYVFWFVGGTDPDTYARARAEKQINALPSNHSPRFAPVLDPTLRTGLEAMLCAASPWLAPADEAA